MLRSVQRHLPEEPRSVEPTVQCSGFANYEHKAGSMKLSGGRTSRVTIKFIVTYMVLNSNTTSVLANKARTIAVLANKARTIAVMANIRPNISPDVFYMM